MQTWFLTLSAHNKTKIFSDEKNQWKLYRKSNLMNVKFPHAYKVVLLSFLYKVVLSKLKLNINKDKYFSKTEKSP